MELQSYWNTIYYC